MKSRAAVAVMSFAAALTGAPGWANTVTTHLSLNKPTVGADSNNWGSLSNANWDSLDTIIFGLQGTANAAMPKAGGTFTGGITGTTASFGSTLGVTGLLTGNGGVSTTALSVSGAATLSSTLGVTGLATLNGGLNVSSGATVNGGLSANGTVTINGGTPMTTSSATITANAGTCAGVTGVTGNTSAGIFHTTASCAVSGTFIIVFPVSAPTGWVCVAQDSDNLGVVFRENSFTSNRCTIVVTSTATGPSDGVLFSATPF